jgi:SAM-dependent methyltransferase
MHVLDIGCGLGGTARFIASRYGSRVVGIDLTTEYVETGNRKSLPETLAFNLIGTTGILPGASPPAAAPLPATLPLFASGLGAMGLFGWRRKRKNAAPMAG